MRERDLSYNKMTDGEAIHHTQNESPISVGFDDPLLARLRAEHGEKRSETYPGYRPPTHNGAPRWK